MLHAPAVRGPGAFIRSLVKGCLKVLIFEFRVEPGGFALNIVLILYLVSQNSYLEIKDSLLYLLYRVLW